jgi:hypothetical protein
MPRSNICSKVSHKLLAPDIIFIAAKITTGVNPNNDSNGNADGKL